MLAPILVSFIETHKRILSLLFVLLCVSGFMIQVEQVSEIYFRFRTTTKTEFQVKETEQYQMIDFCPRYLDLLDRTRYKEYGIQKNLPRNLTMIFEELSILTVKQILDLTPSSEEIIQMCLVRKGIMSSVKSLKRPEECLDFFEVSKSVNGEKVCYRFMPRNQSSYSVGDVASSLTHMNIVWEITLQPVLGKTIFGFFINHFTYSSEGGSLDPLVSRMFGIKIDNANTFNESGFFVYGQSFEIKRLPHPYDSQCTPNHDRQACYEECLIDRFKSINRIPWSGFHRKHIDKKIYTYKDNNSNKTMARVAETAFKECHTSCKIKTECQTIFSITSVQENVSLRKRFYIASMVPGGPRIWVYTVPLLTLIEYVVQVGSCCGIWFGLSIVSLDPVKWMIRRAKKGCHDNFRISAPRLSAVNSVWRQWLKQREIQK